MQTIQDILKSDENKLPIVIKTANGQLNNAISREPVDKEEELPVLFDKQVEIIYAHVRILPFADEHKYMSEKGRDCLLIRNGFVNDELLLPLRYPGKLKVIPHPQKRPRYASVAQILENPPRYVRVEEDISSVDVAGRNNILIPAKLKLKIKGVTASNDTSNDSITYLKCIGEDGVTYQINENSHVNFTGLLDTELYTMRELVNTSLLPKVIEFQDVSATDVVELYQDKAESLSTILDGPIEILGVKILEFIVGWPQQECGKHSRAVIIPKESWDQLSVQVIKFDTEEEKSTYIEKTFGGSKYSVFIEEKLYFIPCKAIDVVWLKTPKHNECSSMLTMDKTERQGVTHLTKKIEKTGLGTLRAKIVSKLVNKKHKDNPSDKHKYRRLPWLKRTLSFGGFDKNYMKTKQIDDDSTGELTARSTCIHDERPLPPIPETTDGKRKEKRNITRSVSESVPCPSNIYDEIDKEDNHLSISESEYTEMNFGSDYIAMNIGGASKHLSQEHISKKNVYEYSVGELANRFRGCGMCTLADLCVEQNIDGPVLKDKGLECLKEIPFSISEHDFTIVKKIIENEDIQNKTFADLSVDEVCELFKLWSLDETAGVCFEHKLDGNFLDSYNLQDLKHEPFCLSDDKINIVRTIVHGGCMFPSDKL